MLTEKLSLAQYDCKRTTEQVTAELLGSNQRRMILLSSQEISDKNLPIFAAMLKFERNL